MIIADTDFLYFYVITAVAKLSTQI